MSARLAAWEESLAIQLRHFAPKSTEAAWLIRCFDCVDSTMDEARALLGEIDPSRPALVLAQGQTKGRGRQGRAWHQSSQAMYATFALATSRPPGELSGLSLVVGVVLRDILVGMGCEVGVKWPNDVLSLDGRKVGGILIEQVSSHGCTNVLCGIGLNLASPPCGFEKAVSVADLSGLQPTPIEMAARIGPVLFDEFCLFREQGFFVFKDRFLAGSLFLGAEVAIEIDGTVHRGLFEGVTDTGALLLKAQDTTKEIITGHFVSVEGFPGSGNFCS